MNRRLQTRSMVTSVVVHVLLLVLLLMAPGFRRPHEDRLLSGPPLELVPGSLVEAALAPTPARAAPAPVRPVRQQPEPVRPARPDPPKPQPIREPEPTPVVREQPRERPVQTVQPPRREQSRFDLSKARSIREIAPRRDPRKEQSAQSNTRSRMRALDRQLASAAGSLARSTAAGAVEIRIGGGGSANAWHIRNAYDAAWITPNVTDTGATTEVEVVIRGDGTVVRSRIVRRSGNAALDDSVERALRAVTRIEPFEPFPAGETITFTIGFNLKSRSNL